MPDLFTAYPRVAEEIGLDRLLDWDGYLSEKERSAYVDAFLEEGIIDGRLVMLPIAKSTELLFLNKTIFDRFSTDTGRDHPQGRTDRSQEDAGCGQEGSGGASGDGQGKSR